MMNDFVKLKEKGCYESPFAETLYVEAERVFLQSGMMRGENAGDEEVEGF